MTPNTATSATALVAVTRSTIWFVSLWTIFLVIPIALIVTLSDASLAWRIIGVVATLVFGVAFVRISIRQARTPQADSVRIREVLRDAAVLIFIGAAAGPALGMPSAIYSFAPYLAAVGLFTLPRRIALVWAAGVAATMIASGFLYGAGPSFTAMFMPLLVIGTLVLIRFASDQSELEDRARTEVAAVQEREAIARDVHDVLGHTLTVVALKTQLARRTVRSRPERAEAELDEVLRLTQTALDDVRATVGRLRIPDLAAQLDAAKAALDDAGVTTTVRGSWHHLSPERRALAAWLVREATTNLLRHAEATECVIVFDADRIAVIDDGVGLDGAAEGHGLTGLRRRVQEAGGALELSAAHPGRERPGTRLEVVFP